jgi:4-carboxymuconolactone decarboxylase
MLCCSFDTLESVGFVLDSWRLLTGGVARWRGLRQNSHLRKHWGKRMNEEEKLKMARLITDALPAPEEIRDDWGTLIVETVLPEGVWSRPGLSPRDRSLITLAALTVLHMPNELRLHLGRGLDNGLTRTEISEMIMHLAIYGGFPVAVEAMGVAREVFDGRAE